MGEEEEDQSVEDSEEGSEEDSPGSLFLFFWGGLQGTLVFGLAFVLFWGAGVCFTLGVGVSFGLGGTFPDQGGGLQTGGEAHELLPVSGDRGLVVNAAPALHLRLQDATMAGQMVDQACQYLHCCNWLQVKLQQQGRDVYGPGVASRPAHDEVHRPLAATTDVHILNLQGG